MVGLCGFVKIKTRLSKESVIQTKSDSLLYFWWRVFAQVFNDTAAAARFAREASVAAMQDKPVMYIDFKFCGNHF